MNVLLLAYGERARPHGLVDIALFLRQHDYSVEIAHLWEDPKRAHRIKTEPDIVGITSYTMVSGRLRKVIEIIRKRWPRAQIVLGGHHINHDVLEKETDLPELADWCVIGPGEYAMLDILEGCQPGVKIGEPLSQADFERLPFASTKHARQLFYARGQSVLLNRGCPYSCTFCTAYRKRILRRDPGQAVAFLKRLNTDLKHPKLFIEDDIFAVDIRWLRSFAKEVERQKLVLPLRCFIHGRMFDDERMALLRRAGVVHATLGAESGDDRVLALAKKHATLADYERIDAMFRAERDISLHCLWMLGLPGETKDSLATTLDAARRLGTRRPNFCYATPFPGCEFYRDATKYGRIVQSDWTKWHTQSISFVPHGLSRRDLRRAMARGRAIAKRRAE